MSDEECPVCDEEWTWSHPNSENYTIACSQADRLCTTKDAIYFHQDSHKCKTCGTDNIPSDKDYCRSCRKSGRAAGDKANN